MSGTPLPSDSDNPVIHTDLGGGVVRLTLNRPEQRNAMDGKARAELVAAFARCEQTARVIVLTGRGVAFCSGLDMKEKNPRASDEWRHVQDVIRQHPAIVIAAVNGHALGGGVTLINAADLAVAVDDAQIGLPEVTFGIYPAMSGPSTQLRIGAKRAAWMVLTGERISGRTAEQWGLVNLSVPAEELDGAATALAHKLAGYDRMALRLCKRALAVVPGQVADWHTALEYGQYVNGELRYRRSLTDAEPPLPPAVLP